jgi:putative thioredoxin
MSADHEMRADFRTEVLDRSHEIPVVVDFWAEWCGPCRVLGPVLEKMAEDARGRWELVKVDTERFPEIARALRIQGIPAVKLFHQGKIVGEFVGALGETQIAAWLEQHLPAPSDDPWTQAQALLTAGETALARAALERALQEKPDHEPARLELAKLVLRDDPHAARDLLEQIKGETEAYSVAQNLLHLIGVVEWARGNHAPGGGAGQDGSALELYRAGAHAFAAGDADKALENWVEVVARDRGIDEDGARRACIALFAVLGEDHPVTQNWRRRFSMALAV